MTEVYAWDRSMPIHGDLPDWSGGWRVFYTTDGAYCSGVVLRNGRWVGVMVERDGMDSLYLFIPIEDGWLFDGALGVTSLKERLTEISHVLLVEYPHDDVCYLQPTATIDPQALDALPYGGILPETYRQQIAADGGPLDAEAVAQKAHTFRFVAPLPELKG